MLGPVLEAFANDPAFDFILAKINVDDNPNIAMRYGVQGIPAVKAFIDGQVADGGYGSTSEYVRELIRRDRDRQRRGEDRLPNATLTVKRQVSVWLFQ